MPSFRNVLLAVCVLTAVAGAQSFSSTFPPVIGFVDLTTTAGATMIVGIGDDSEHSIPTTVGNPMFPAAAACIGNNGAAASVAGVPAIAFTNATIAATGVPVGLPAAAAGILCAYWDDLYPAPLNPTSIWWYEAAGVLYIQWNMENHFASLVAGEGITFQIQVFGAPAAGAPWVQFLYPDATFGGTMAINNNGASATVGYVKGTNPSPAANTLYSFNTVGSIPDGTTLSIFPPFLLTATSPCGPGDLDLDFISGPPLGSYFLVVTLFAGAYPAGWLYGVDIPYGELLGLLATGFPFLGPLDAGGAFSLGPFGCGALPSGLTFYAVGLGTPAGGPVPTVHTPAIAYTIP